MDVSDYNDYNYVGNFVLKIVQIYLVNKLETCKIFQQESSLLENHNWILFMIYKFKCIRIMQRQLSTSCCSQERKVMLGWKI
jgi:hypothetical protein